MPEFIYNSKVYYNSVEFLMDRIGGTWKMPVLWRLQDKTLRYSEIKRTLPRITHKMLTSALRELEQDGMIQREVFAVVPPRVEYQLTDRGRFCIPLIAELRKYGFSLMNEFGISVPEQVQ